ncbi:hypothetical protein CLF_100916 [Clonorchis sinensis]|uniref:Uncharacterized protein n=1 Tax=Clonorchis sinensis TaxID=79923 RepID=G7Y4J2_CLOSI|nr:hypothetical protein CLF_100916 [Clonorchis sinensis]
MRRPGATHSVAWKHHKREIQLGSRLAAEALAITNGEHKNSKLCSENQPERTCEPTNLRENGGDRKRSFLEMDASRKTETSDTELCNKRPFRPSDLENKPYEQGQKSKGTILYDLLSGRENLHTASLRSQLFLLSFRDVPKCVPLEQVPQQARLRKRLKPIRKHNGAFTYLDETQSKASFIQTQTVDSSLTSTHKTRLLASNKYGRNAPRAESLPVFDEPVQSLRPRTERFVDLQKIPQKSQKLSWYPEHKLNNRSRVRLSCSGMDLNSEQPLDLSHSKRPVSELFGSRCHNKEPLHTFPPSITSDEHLFADYKQKGQQMDKNSVKVKYTPEDNKEAQSGRQSPQGYELLLQHFVQLLMSPLNLTMLSSKRDMKFSNDLSKQLLPHLPCHPKIIQPASPSSNGSTSPRLIPKQSSPSIPFKEQHLPFFPESVVRGNVRDTSPCSSNFAPSETSKDSPNSSPSIRLNRDTSKDEKLNEVIFNSSQHMSQADQVISSFLTQPQALVNAPSLPNLNLTRNIPRELQIISGCTTPHRQENGHTHVQTRDSMGLYKPIKHSPPILAMLCAVNKDSAITSNKTVEASHNNIAHALHSSVRRWIVKLVHLLKKPEELFLECFSKMSVVESSGPGGFPQQVVLRCSSALMLELRNTSSETRLRLVQESWHQLFAIFALEEHLDIVSFARYKLEHLFDALSESQIAIQSGSEQSYQRIRRLSKYETIQLEDTVRYLHLLQNAIWGMELNDTIFVLIRMALLLSGVHEDASKEELFHNTETAILHDLKASSPSSNALTTTQVNTTLKILRALRKEPIRILFRDFLEEPVELILCRLLSD